MTNVIEIGVYCVVLFVFLFATVIFFLAGRRFVKGEFKEFIDWVSASSTALTLGSMLNLLNVIFSATIYAPTFLVVAGFAYVLTGFAFIRASLLLHNLSKTFGFAEIGKDLGHIFGKGRKHITSKAASK